MESVVARLVAQGIEPGTPRGIGETAGVQSRELQDRVVRRAGEIRQRWRKQDPTAPGLAFEAESLEPVSAGDAGLPPLSSDNRLLRDVPLDAIRRAIHASFPKSGRMEYETLIRECAQALGFHRLSKKLRGRLIETIGAEVRDGRLQSEPKGNYIRKDGVY